MSFVLPPASAEQIAVKDFFATDETGNVMLNSVAGSGKTTTSLYLAMQLPAKRILLLTYNSRLKMETRDKAASLHLRNLEAHSFHAFGYKYYSERCIRDQGLVEVVQVGSVPSRAIPRYDIIVIDESQDINQILFSFVSKIIRDHYAQHKVSPQLMIIGDGNQCVYRFKGSDDRYLTLANKLFEDLQRPESSWNAFKLSISYRVTGNMALFVNKVMLNEKNLVAFKSAGPPVHYIVGSPYAAVEAIGHELISMIKKDFIKPSDVFLLNASLNSTNNKMPIRVLENMLSESGIPVYVPQGDEEALRVDVIEGKVALSTFHSVKGLERKVVVIFGFNLKYFSYYAKEEDPTRCPCPLYVAVTRATDMLCLIAEDQENEHLPFLDIRQLNHLDNVGAVQIHRNIPDYGFMLDTFKTDWAVKTSDPPDIIPREINDNDLLSAKSNLAHLNDLRFLIELERSTKYPEKGVSDLVKWLPDPVTCICKALLKPIRIMEPTELIDMPSTAPGNQSSVEEVSDLNGLAIPAMLEVDVQWGQQTEDISLKPKTKTCSMYSLLKLASQEMTENGDLVMHSSVREKLRELKKPVDMTAPADFLKLAAVYQAGAGVSRKGYISRLVQLQGYDWMTLSSALACLNNLRMAIPDYRSAKFEYLMQEIVVGKEAKGIMLQGQADIVTPAVLWEVKCVQSLLEVHFLQLGLYAWLWRRNMEVSHGPRLFKLINVRNNEIWEIQTQNLDMIVSIVMSQFHRKQDKESDDAFLSSAKVCSSTSVRFEWELSDYKGCEEWFRSTEDIIAQQQHQQHDSSGIENDCDVLLRWDGETTKRSLVPRGGSLEPLTKRQRCSASIVAGRSAETAIEIDLD